MTARDRLTATIDAICTLDLISLAMASREAQGLHVHWRLPDGSQWSAYASTPAQKEQWIAAKARLGWVYLPELG